MRCRRRRESAWHIAKTLIGRAFTAIEALADKQAKLDDTTALLAGAQVRLAEAQVKNEERFRATDERIDRLTSAIGEFIRRLPEPRA